MTTAELLRIHCANPECRTVLFGKSRLILEAVLSPGTAMLSAQCKVCNRWTRVDVNASGSVVRREVVTKAA